MVKHLSAMQETWVWSPGWEHPLKKEIAAHSSILPGKSHGQRRLVGYRPLGHRVRHDWETSLHSLSFEYKYICLLHDNYTLKVFKFKINWPNLHIKVKKYKQLTRKQGKAHRHVRRIVNSYKSEATCSTFHTEFRNCCMRVSWEKKGNSFIYNKNVNS